MLYFAGILSPSKMEVLAHCIMLSTHVSFTTSHTRSVTVRNCLPAYRLAAEIICNTPEAQALLQEPDAECVVKFLDDMSSEGTPFRIEKFLTAAPPPPGSSPQKKMAPPSLQLQQPKLKLSLPPPSPIPPLVNIPANVPDQPDAAAPFGAGIAGEEFEFDQEKIDEIVPFDKDNSSKVGAYAAGVAGQNAKGSKGKGKGKKGSRERELAEVARPVARPPWITNALSIHRTLTKHPCKLSLNYSIQRYFRNLLHSLCQYDLLMVHRYIGLLLYDQFLSMVISC